MDDITFCMSDCQRTDCVRHPSNIQDRTIPHSYADFKRTPDCPEFAKDINVPINDDTISRKTVIDALWKAMYEYEDKMEKQFIESDDLDIEDWIQHRIFVQNMSDIDRQTILELPSVQPDIRCKDCKHWMPYDWMFSEVWQSKNIADYPEDDIGCDCCDMAMKANDFCSRAERRTDG